MARRQDYQPKIDTDVQCGTPKGDQAERMNTFNQNMRWQMNVGRHLAQIHGHYDAGFFKPPVGTYYQLIAGQPHVMNYSLILSSMQYLASPVNDYMHLAIKYAIDDLEYLDPGGIQPTPGAPQYGRGRVEVVLHSNGNSLVLYSAYEDGGTAKYASDPRNAGQEVAIDASATTNGVIERLARVDVQLPDDMQPGPGEYFVANLEIKYYDFMLTRPLNEVYTITDPSIKYLGVETLTLEHYNPGQ